MTRVARALFQRGKAPDYPLPADAGAQATVTGWLVAAALLAGMAALG
jgi:hypothetical protein